jgi:hypothetical protein
MIDYNGYRYIWQQLFDHGHVKVLGHAAKTIIAETRGVGLWGATGHMRTAQGGRLRDVDVFSAFLFIIYSAPVVLDYFSNLSSLITD